MLPRPVVAAAPLGLHALEEVAGHLDAQLRLPLPDQFGHRVVQEGLVPFVHDRLPLRPAAAGAHGERDPAVIEADGGLRLLFLDRQQVAPSPEVMALTLDELARCLPRLATQLRLLVPDPAELGYRIGAGHLKARSLRARQA